MPRSVLVLIFSAAMLATVGFASTNSLIAEPSSGPAVRRTPAPAARAPAAGNARPTTIHWDKFYDRSGDPLPGEPGDNVSTDSLYFKNYSSTTVFYGCPKSQVPNPAPANCRPAFAWQTNQTAVGMDPLGIYCYGLFALSCG